MGPTWHLDSSLSDRALSLCRLTGTRCKVFDGVQSSSRDTATLSNADRLAAEVLELVYDDRTLFLA